MRSSGKYWFDCVECEPGQYGDMDTGWDCLDVRTVRRHSMLLLTVRLASNALKVDTAMMIRLVNSNQSPIVRGVQLVSVGSTRVWAPATARHDVSTDLQKRNGAGRGGKYQLVRIGLEPNRQ